MVVGGWCSYLNKRSLHNLKQFTSKCRESGSAAQSRFDVGENRAGRQCERLVKIKKTGRTRQYKELISYHYDSVPRQTAVRVTPWTNNRGRCRDS